MCTRRRIRDARNRDSDVGFLPSYVRDSAAEPVGLNLRAGANPTLDSGLEAAERKHVALKRKNVGRRSINIPFKGYPIALPVLVKMFLLHKNIRTKGRWTAGSGLSDASLDQAQC